MSECTHPVAKHAAKLGLEPRAGTSGWNLMLCSIAEEIEEFPETAENIDTLESTKNQSKDNMKGFNNESRAWNEQDFDFVASACQRKRTREEALIQGIGRR